MATDTAIEMADTLKSGSNLEKVLAQGRFAVTGELGPPKHMDTTVIDRKIDLLQGVVDAANITDNQTGIVRLSSIATGIYMAQRGLEPVIQITCRDRNRLAIQSDLMGAYIHGIRNVLCLSGDHQSFGNHPGAKNVQDIDSIQLIHMVQQMRDKHQFQCGDEIIGGGPKLLIGGAGSPFSEPISFRPSRLAKKMAAGVDFIQTQMIFDMNIFRQFMSRLVDLGVAEKVHILAGIGPLKSSPMARFLNERIPGIVIPEEILQRMDGAVQGISEGDKGTRRDAWRAEGQNICVEQIQELREIEGVAGIHIMAIEWEAAIRPIVDRAGLLPRPAI
jgi:methylenetetrahydrofolate reductase (NADPH)